MEGYIGNLARTGQLMMGLLFTVWVLVRPATWCWCWCWCCYLVLLHLCFSQTARMATLSASNFVQEVKPGIHVDPLTGFRDPLAHLPPALHQEWHQAVGETMIWQTGLEYSDPDRVCHCFAHAVQGTVCQPHVAGILQQAVCVCKRNIYGEQQC